MLLFLDRKLKLLRPNVPFFIFISFWNPEIIFGLRKMFPGKNISSFMTGWWRSCQDTHSSKIKHYVKTTFQATCVRCRHGSVTPAKQSIARKIMIQKFSLYEWGGRQHSTMVSRLTYRPSCPGFDSQRTQKKFIGMLLRLINGAA